MHDIWKLDVFYYEEYTEYQPESGVYIVYRLLLCVPLLADIVSLLHMLYLGWSHSETETENAIKTVTFTSNLFFGWSVN